MSKAPCACYHFRFLVYSFPVLFASEVLFPMYEILFRMCVQHGRNICHLTRPTLSHAVPKRHSSCAIDQSRARRSLSIPPHSSTNYLSITCKPVEHRSERRKRLQIPTSSRRCSCSQCSSVRWQRGEAIAAIRQASRARCLGTIS